MFVAATYSSTGAGCFLARLGVVHHWRGAESAGFSVAVVDEVMGIVVFVSVRRCRWPFSVRPLSLSVA
jgi:hypothetical protein